MHIAPIKLARTMLTYKNFSSFAKVEEDLTRLGISASFTDKQFLRAYPLPSYSALLNKLTLFRTEFAFDELLVDPPYKIDGFNFDAITNQFLKGRLNGRTLTLRETDKKFKHFRQYVQNQLLIGPSAGISSLAQLNARPAIVDTILEKIASTKTDFKTIEKAALEGQPIDSDCVYSILEKAIRELGFGSVTIVVPLEDPYISKKGPLAVKWGCVVRNTNFRISNGDSYVGKYDFSKGGSFPQTTLASALRVDRRVFDVDISDETTAARTFSSASLQPDWISIAEDWKNSVGPGNMLFIKLVSKYGPEAWIHIHNRVPIGQTPKDSLFPGGASHIQAIKTALELFFELPVKAIENMRDQEIRRQEQSLGLVPTEKPPSLTQKADAQQEPQQLSSATKKALLQQAQLLPLRGEKVRLFHSPAQAFMQQGGISQVVDWLIEFTLSVYKGTEIARGKNREELIEMLSMEPEKMRDRLIACKYLALIEGSGLNSDRIQGMVSAEPFNIDGQVVFRVPASMIHKSVRGKKLQTSIATEIFRRVFLEEWFNQGLFKGFFHMLRKGMPFYVTTQSLRVVKDLMVLKDLSVVRIANGQALLEGQKNIIGHGSGGKADWRGIEADVYGGRIAIDEEEEGIILHAPWFFAKWPILRWFFKKQLALDGKIKKILLQDMGEKDRLHILGYFTIFTFIKINFNLFLNRLDKRRKPKK